MNSLNKYAFAIYLANTRKFEFAVSNENITNSNPFLNDTNNCFFLIFRNEISGLKKYPEIRGQW